MFTNPDIVLAPHPHRGLVAHSGWEQVEARAVLRDLGWQWEAELHALVPPDDMTEADAGTHAVEALELHGHRTGYATGPYGVMRLTTDRAEQVFARAAVHPPYEGRSLHAEGRGHESATRAVEPANSRVRKGEPYGHRLEHVQAVPERTDDPPAL
ncbi:hypothetical protein GCM10027091_10300 [Streptomyces daliensis]